MTESQWIFSVAAFVGTMVYMAVGFITLSFRLDRIERLLKKPPEQSESQP